MAEQTGHILTLIAAEIDAMGGGSYFIDAYFGEILMDLYTENMREIFTISKSLFLQQRLAS